jgi:hypothetical protein
MGELSVQAGHNRDAVGSGWGCGPRVGLVPRPTLLKDTTPLALMWATTGRVVWVWTGTLARTRTGATSVGIGIGIAIGIENEDVHRV